MADKSNQAALAAGVSQKDAKETTPKNGMLNMHSRATLGDGKTMPILGFGTYLIEEKDAEACVSKAIEIGYRHIDTAELYKNEAAVGRALASSGIDRSALFVTTKLWPGNPAWGMPAKTFETTIKACNESLERLGLKYVDLYLIHAPLCQKERLAQYRALVELQKLGKCRSIGVSNYGIAHLEELESAKLPFPAANQLELHPFGSKTKLCAFMKRRGILPIAYSSLAPLSNWRTGQKCNKTDAMRKEASPFAAVAKAHGLSEAQVLLRWALQKGFPILPKSTKVERMRQNAALFGTDAQLSDAEMAAITRLEKGACLAWPGMNPCNSA